MKTTSPAPKKRLWLRILVGVVGLLVLLVIVGYFILTSSGFLKSVILPAVGKSMNAEITISDAAIHPFSSVTLHNLKVTPNGRETLLTAPEIRARYTLMDILGGKLSIAEVVISSPTIHLVENPDGSSNLDPILKAQEKSNKSPQEKRPADKSSQPPQINLQKLALSNATILKEKLYAGGTRDVMQVTNLNVTLTNLKNGESGKLLLNADVFAQNTPPSPGTNGLLQAAANGEYNFTFSPDLKPVSVKGQTQLTVSRAEGAFNDLAAVGLNLTADISPTEINEVEVRFKKGQDALGELRVSGPLNMEKTEGRLKIELLGLDKRALNLAGAGSGIDFGTTAITSSNDLQIANAGSMITLIGRFDLSKLQLTRTNQTTPTLDLGAAYDMTVNTATSNAVLRTLTMIGTQNGQPLLNADLSSPMTLAIGGANNSVGDSAFNLTLVNLNLADWKPFLGDSISSGNVGLKMKLLAQQGGKQIMVSAVSQLKNLAPIGGDKTLASATVAADLSVQMAANEDKLVKGGVQFTNVVVNDPSGTIPNTPLEVKLQLDTTLQKEAIDLRQLQVTLTPTARAQNQLQLQGRVDLSDTNAMQGNLKLSSESLDLTTYYDLFAGKKTATTAETSTKSKPVPGTLPAKPEAEPPAQKLPFRNFVLQANLGRMYLREIEITNLQTTVKLDGGHVLMKPFQLTLNGAPVNASADLDLGVPGYRYAVEFNADQIPFAPLVNSFQPESKGQLGGALSAHAQISGLGTTGTNLQQNLKGQFDVGTTNLNLDVINIRNPILKTIINVVYTLPQLLKNPAAALGSLVSSFTSSGKGGFSDELSKSPIEVISARGSAGSGKVQLDQALVRSAIFQAEAHGEIALAPVLTNSTLQIPIKVSLSQGVASKMNLSAPEVTNSGYVALPDFLTVKGTIGKPKEEINKGVLASIAMHSVTGAIPGTEKAGNLIQGILGGKTSATNAPGSATNASPVGNLLNNLFKKKK